MPHTIQLYESSYLCYELTAAANQEFIDATFNHLTDLEDGENDSWESLPESERFFRARPIGGERPITTASLRLPIKELLDSLGQYGLQQYDQVRFVADVVYEPYRHIMRGATCVGVDGYAILIQTQHGYVTQLWFDGNGISENRHVESMAACLHSTGVTHSLLLIDWYKKRVIDLANKASILSFLNES